MPIYPEGNGKGSGGEDKKEIERNLEIAAALMYKPMHVISLMKSSVTKSPESIINPSLSSFL